MCFKSNDIIFKTCGILRNNEDIIGPFCNNKSIPTLKYSKSWQMMLYGGTSNNFETPCA